MKCFSGIGRHGAQPRGNGRKPLDWEAKMRLEIMKQAERYGATRGIDSAVIQDRVDKCAWLDHRGVEPHVVVHYEQRPPMEAPVSQWGRVVRIIRIRCERVSRDLARAHGASEWALWEDEPDTEDHLVSVEKKLMCAGVRKALIGLGGELAYVAKRAFLDHDAVARIARDLNVSDKWVRYRKDKAKDILRTQLRKYA